MANHLSTNQTTERIQPALSWVYQSPLRIVAFGFGSGLLRPAPGTWGTLTGWLIWVLALSQRSDAFMAVFLILAFALGCWACQRAGQDVGVSDHGGMVWDEMVAIWLVLWLSPSSWKAQLLAVVLFRVFDIIKPAPIRYFDKRWDNGFGVMWDDILAAAYSLLVIAVLVRAGILS